MQRCIQLLFTFAPIYLCVWLPRSSKSQIVRGSINSQDFAPALEEILEDAGASYISDQLRLSANVIYTSPDGASIVHDLAGSLRLLFEDRAYVLQRLRNVTVQYGFTKRNAKRDCCLGLGEEFYYPIYRVKYDVRDSCFIKSQFSPKSPIFPPPEFTEVAKQNRGLLKGIVTQQYIATEDGILVDLPSFDIGSSCFTYDPRLRNFYVGAANTKYKSVVFMVDTSVGNAFIGRHTAPYFSTVASAITLILRTLGTKDDVSLVSFPHTVKGNDQEQCFLKKMVPLTQNEFVLLPKLVRTLKASPTSNFTALLYRGLNILSKTNTNLDKQAVLFLYTAGSPNDTIESWKNLFRLFFQRSSIKWSNNPILLIFGLSAKSEHLNNELRILRSQFPGKARYFLVNNTRELLQRTVVYYRELPINLKAIPYLTPPLSTPNSTDVKMSFSQPVIVNNTLMGVVGIDLDYNFILSAVDSDRVGVSESYPFLVDQYDGSIIFHPLYAFQTDIQFVHVRQLESSPNSAEAITKMLQSLAEGDRALGQSDELEDHALIISQGDPFKEGVITVTRNITLFYENVHFDRIKFGVCYVEVHGSEEIVFEPVLNATRNQINLFYHRADLQLRKAANASYCNGISATTVKAQTFTIFTLPAFLDASAALFREETREDLTVYNNIVRGSAPNTLFEEGVLTELFLVSVLDDFWDRGFLSYELNSYLIRKYFATQHGVIKIYPGPIGYSAVNHISRPWYQKAIARRDLIVVTPPYVDLFDAGIVITIVRPVLFPGTSDIFGILGIDITLAFFNQLVSDYFWRDCTSEYYTCFITDQSGFVIFHQGWLELSRKQVLSILDLHIIGIEPWIAVHLIETNLMTKRTCQNRFQQREQGFFVLTLDYIDYLNQSNALYRAASIPGTNMFVFQKLTNAVYETGVQCQCSREERPECKLNQTSCECPCFFQAYFDTCQGLSDRTDWTPCSNVQPSGLNRYTDWKITTGSFPPCSGSFCENNADKRSCAGAAQCSWCDKDSTGKPLKLPFCELFVKCPYGFLLPEKDETVLIALLSVSFALAVIIICCLLVWHFWKKRRSKLAGEKTRQQACIETAASVSGVLPETIATPGTEETLTEDHNAYINRVSRLSRKLRRKKMSKSERRAKRETEMLNAVIMNSNLSDSAKAKVAEKIMSGKPIKVQVPASEWGDQEHFNQY